MKLFLAFMIAMLATTVSAQTPTAETQSSAPAGTPAMRIATRLASEEIMLAQTRKVLRQQLPAVLNADADMREMEKRWPGVTVEFIGAMGPVILASLAERLPAYRHSVAEIFARHMSTGELQVTAAFYDSPTGEHLLLLARQGIDVTTMLRREISAEGGQMSGADLRAAVSPALQPAINELSGREQILLVAFGMTSAGRKMVPISTELLELAARFNNETDSETDAKLDKVVMTIVDRRTSRSRGRP